MTTELAAEERLEPAVGLGERHRELGARLGAHLRILATEDAGVLVELVRLGAEEREDLRVRPRRALPEILGADDEQLLAGKTASHRSSCSAYRPRAT